MLVLASSEGIFYVFNKVFLVLGYIDAEDVGGSMTIHMFGAYFGLAASYALGKFNRSDGFVPAFILMTTESGIFFPFT